MLETILTAAGNGVGFGAGLLLGVLGVLRAQDTDDYYARRFMTAASFVLLLYAAQRGWWMVASWLREDGFAHHQWMYHQREWVALIPSVLFVVFCLRGARALRREHADTRISTAAAITIIALCGLVGGLGAM